MQTTISVAPAKTETETDTCYWSRSFAQHTWHWKFLRTVMLSKKLSDHFNLSEPLPFLKVYKKFQHIFTILSATKYCTDVRKRTIHTHARIDSSIFVPLLKKESSGNNRCSLSRTQQEKHFWFLEIPTYSS
jgi:hypothetical protein